MDQNSSSSNSSSSTISSSTKRRKNNVDASTSAAEHLKSGHNGGDHLETAILSIDIGTTNLKCSLYDQQLQCLYSCSSKLNILQPRENYSEIDPDDLFRILKENIEDCLRNCPSNYKLKCFGVSAQRNSITLWNRKTDERYSNFILWNDKRTSEICEAANASLSLFTIKKLTHIYSRVFANHHLKAISKYKMETTHVTPRLIGQLKALENRLEAHELEDVMYGSVDTWIIYKLTREKTFAIDVSCACATGFYDLFLDKWSNFLCYIFQIPYRILPSVHDSCHEYGNLRSELFQLDYNVPLTASIGDVQSSLIAECAFHTGDVVITVGTGAFLSVNVGDKPVSSQNDNYPLIGYRHGTEQAYLLHSPVSSPGVAIEWAKSIGLFQEFDQIEGILKSTQSSNGVYFFPGFGLFNKNDVDHENGGRRSPSPKSAPSSSIFYGIKSNTTRAEMLKSIFDAIAYTVKIKFDAILRDLDALNIRVNSIKIAGGVAKSDFLCQYLSNLLNRSIERNKECHTSSSLGAAFLAGLGAKIWRNLHDLNAHRKNVQIFEPSYDCEKKYFNYLEEMERWKKVVML